MEVIDWVPGDMLGLQIPAHSAALRSGGESFLTAAFRASGALAADNCVARITHFEELLVGGTGRKLLLSVAYENPAPNLPDELFVKFSRNFSDEIRDRMRYMLDSEVRFAALSRVPGFPIAVPTCLFADYQKESGTGLLITERIAFGTGGIERHYQKCLDHEMSGPLGHYKALIKALARLAGAHRAGRLSDGFDRQFPFDAEKSIQTDLIRYGESDLQRRVAKFAAFAAKFPQLLPANIASQDFAAKLSNEVPLFLKHELSIRRLLHSKPDFIALCHWNANIDNAWFWRNENDELECGLMDWARVDQMTVAQAVYGAFSSADTELWDEHLDDIVALFAAEFHRVGGPLLDPAELKFHVHLVTAMMGVAYLLDAPAIIQAQMPALAEVESRFDPRFKASEYETARVQLHMLIMFLNQWQTRDFGAVLDEVLRRTATPRALVSQ